MKTLLQLAIAVCAMGCFVGCSTDSDDSTTKSTPLNVRASLEAPDPTTRTVISPDGNGFKVDWNNGDTLNIWTVNPLGWAVPQVFTYNKDGQFTSKATITPGTYTFRATYTDKAQIAKTIINSLASQQKQMQSSDTKTYGRYDCLVGEAQNVKVPDNSVYFAMKHIYAWLRIDITNSTSKTITIRSVDISTNAAISGDFTITNFSTASITPVLPLGLTAKTINTDMNSRPVQKGTKTSCYIVMAPLTAYTGSIVIKVNYGSSSSQTFTKNVTALTLVRGKVHSTSVTLADD